MSAPVHPRRPPAAAFRLLLRLPVPWVFVLGYLAGVGVEAVYPSRPWMETHLNSSVGVTVFAAGAAFAAWGWLLFRREGTTTVPGEASIRLVTWGPYRISRNPMYVGLTVAYLGEAGILMQAWPALVLPLVIAYVNWIVIPLEEERLRQVFGPVYEVYSARVRRWL